MNYQKRLKILVVFMILCATCGSAAQVLRNDLAEQSFIHIPGPNPVLMIGEKGSWDDITRRPSHADRCAALRHETLKETFFETFFGHNRKNPKIARQFYRLMKLAA